PDPCAHTTSGHGRSGFRPPCAHDGAPEKLLPRLTDPRPHERLRNDMLTSSDEWENEWQQIPGPESILIRQLQNPKLLPLQGKTIAEVAKLWNKDPMDTI